MKLRMTDVVMSIAIVMALAPIDPASAEDQGSFQRMALREAATDAAVKGKVESALANELSLHGLEIGVDVKGGIILLSGEVPGTGLRSMAGRVAASVPGVKKVMNELIVPHDS